MQRTNFDFDVITGPSTPRPASKPEPDVVKSEPGSSGRLAELPSTIARSDRTSG